MSSIRTSCITKSLNKKYNYMTFEDPILEQVRARIPSLREIGEKYKEEEKKRKRDCLDSSIESLYEQHRNTSQSGRSPKQLTKELEEKIEKRITSRISLSALHRDQRNEEVKGLTDSKDILRKDQYISVRKNLEGQVNQISLELIGLKRRKNEIKGRILDRSSGYRHQKDVDVLADHIMEDAVATYKITPGEYNAFPASLEKGTRKSSIQSNFRLSLAEFYSAEPPPNKRKSLTGEDELSNDEGELSDDESEPEFYRGLWCPISKKFFSGELITAAHIVPYSIGEVNCSYLFNEGNATGHLFSPNNGLLIGSYFERAIDNAQIAIVPVGGEASISDLKVVVFDRSILKRNYSPAFGFDWKSLDGLQLEFRNENRPGLRHLYFKFLLSIFQLRRLKGTGWRSDLSRYAEGKMWGSPDGWLRGSSIRAIARRVGHETDLESFLNTTDLPLVENYDDDDFDDGLLAEEMAVEKILKVTEKTSDDEESDED